MNMITTLEEKPFLLAIKADLDDLLQKQIYADWLDEHGRVSDSDVWRNSEYRYYPRLPLLFEVLGSSVESLWVSDDQEYLTFKTDLGDFSYVVDGDCCSQSWFADINGLDYLIGSMILSVEEMSMDGYNVEDGRTRQDYDSAYGYKIKTTKGYMDIIFRNSSNGYYGGDMSFFKGEVPQKMVQITQNEWRA